MEMVRNSHYWQVSMTSTSNQSKQSKIQGKFELTSPGTFFLIKQTKNWDFQSKVLSSSCSTLQGLEHDSTVLFILQSLGRVVSGEIKMLFNYCKLNCDGKEIGIVIVAFTESLWSFIGLVRVTSIEPKWEAFAIILELMSSANNFHDANNGNDIQDFRSNQFLRLSVASTRLQTPSWSIFFIFFFTSLQLHPPSAKMKWNY